MENKRGRVLAAGLTILCTALSVAFSLIAADIPAITGKPSSDAEKPIRWVEFNIPYDVLKKAMDIDIETYDEPVHVDWTDVLAYLGARYGGDFTGYKAADMDSFVSDIKGGRSVAALTKDMKYFDYYHKAYSAVLGGMLGEYQIKIPADSTSANQGQSGQDAGRDARDLSQAQDGTWKKAYGLKAFSPIADGFYYSDFDDFGENRSYGYSRRHLGHDMMTETGTPVIAVESGTVEALGWNQYGGWRIGIRSYDKQRYYYYAHLRKDDPYADDLYIGAAVTAGDVIGFTGQTGYSLKENTNNIDTPHLHFGMQLIFDEDAKDSPTQIWIDLYSITKLLSSHRCTVIKNEDTGRYERKYQFIEENFYLKEKEASADVSDSDEIELPVIMYHAILKENKKNNKYIVSPDLFERDLKYIKKKGYTPVFMKEVIAFAEGSGTLPEDPIVITFDDGYYNNYYYAYPLLKKYNMKAVLSVVGKMSDEFSENIDRNPGYAHVTWDDILEMHLSGYWEIQNHSYDCHTYEKRNGVSQMKGESDSSYDSFLCSDVMALQDKIAYVTGVAPTTFTYPFGAFSENTDAELRKMGFKATLSCTEGVSTIKKGDPSCLYRIKRHLRPPDVSPEDFFEFLD